MNGTSTLDVISVFSILFGSIIVGIMVASQISKINQKKNKRGK